MIYSKMPPAVLVFAGSDPTGGAGVQASIESITSAGCHPVTVITAVTIQDTEDVHGYAPLDHEIIIEQARAVLEDIPVSAIHIGMIGSADAAEAIHSILIDYPDIPVVLDPILFAGGGTALADDEIAEIMVNLLMPLATVVTPNSEEAYTLSPGADSLDACANSMLDYGCEYVLLTGTHNSTSNVVNTLYSADSANAIRFEWDRLPNNYHGSGCTLAASIAAYIAKGESVEIAAKKAQDYTWNALKHGTRMGMGQYIPNRFYWTSRNQVKN
ncbi:MAG: hydroxymethylpyrimidine/phosphomethylpyrimidine kinase [Gammaproteobacteria bacterium]|nr:MAG: hydroxymethylpyrimidine/phosphomethylpyrimidine kinase [Gammaproteobacteria bacterium]